MVLPAAGEGVFYYSLSVRSPELRAALGVGVLILLWVLAVPAVRQFRVERLAAQPTLVNLSRACALDPARADLHNLRGELYLYSVTSYDPEKAVTAFRRAVELNPRVAGYWLNLARAYEGGGQIHEAHQAVQTALRYDPRNPALAWALGNFEAAGGDLLAALQAWREALHGDKDYGPLAFELGWKLAPDTARLLEHLVPANNAMDFGFLDFLLRKKAGQPDLVWRRIVHRGEPFAPILARTYLERLIFSNRDPAGQLADSRMAQAAWADLLRLVLPARRPEPGNLIFNPGFEDELLHLGFDWRWNGGPGSTPVMDSAMAYEGRRSARVDFDGTENPDFAGFWQMVPVEPGQRYRFTAHLRAQQITSSSAPRWRISATAWSGSHPEVEGREVFQTSEWVEDRIDFTVPRDVCQVIVILIRRADRHFKPQIRGSAWSDGLRLEQLAVASGSTP